MVQALHLMNAPNLQSKLTAPSSAVTHWANEDLPLEEAIEEIYLTVYSRYPAAEERETLIADFDEAQMARRGFVEDLLWSLLNTPEFVYED